MSAGEEHATSATTTKRALVAMERMRRRIDEYERARAEPIAIVGMACRFPGGVVDPETFWELLRNGRDAITEVPGDRWDIDAFFDERPQTPGKISCRWGGFLDRIDRFDHQFFSISRREAVLMDPQQRLFLEATWEALEDAGQAPQSLAGSDTGVYLAVYGTDYSSQVFADLAQINAYSALGNLHSIAAGRVSYLLDLRGPNVAVDTACSSSLTAVHQACQGLRLGETDLAICGAVNAILSPQASISLSQLNESFVGDGRIKTFDASADGFVRGEGCGVVVLKRMSDALRDGDRVYAVIRGSAMTQDGRSAGMTAPNGASQRAMLRRALKASGVRPEQVAFVETHGTGTKLGDPIEVDALADVYGRPDGPPVYLGAVKTNLGHLEAASGMAGLIKAALCVERGQIPPNLHFTQLSPHISFDGTTFAVPTELTPWPAGAQPRVAGVSSFGLSGTNVHLIVEQAPPAEATGPDQRRPLSVLALSAKTGTALVKLARRYQDRLAATAPTDLPDVCYSANTGRAHFPYRLAAVGETATEVAARLGDYVRGEPGEGLAVGRATGATGSDVVFLFSGAGPQRVGMALELYQTQPTFRRVLDHCDKIMQPRLGASLMSALYPEDPESELIYNVEYAVPALFAVEYALAEMWRSWGVEPVAVIGHSLGEYAAACFAGVMPLDDGLSLVAERARLLRELPDVGAMAAIFAPRETVAAELASYDPATIAIAAVNGPANTSVSGLRDTVAALCAAFEARGVEVKRLRVPRPGHSPLVEPILAQLSQALRQVRFAAPRIPLVSNLTGRMWPWDQVPDVEYWCRHTRQAVLFADGIATLADQGYRTFLEIGPATNLLGQAREILPAEGDVLMLPSLRPQQRDWDVLLSTVSQLYVHGAELDWTGFDRDYQRSRVRLPRYPFDPVRCWHEITAAVPAAPGAPSGVVELTGDRADDGAGADRSANAVSLAGSLMTAGQLLAVEVSSREDALVAQLVRSVQRALGYRSAAVDPDEPLANLGLDSLMAVELRNEIQNRLRVPLTVASFLSGATIRSVARTVVAQLPAGPPTGEPEPDPARDTPLRRVARANGIAARSLAPIGDLSGEAADLGDLSGEAAGPGDQPGEAAGLDDTFPLSVFQEGMWFLEQLHPDNAAYLGISAVRIEGPVRRDLLARALDDVVRRHEVARTTFELRDGRPTQVVHPSAALDLPEMDLRGTALGGAELEQRILDTALREPMDIEAAPPVRLALLRIADEEYVLVAAAHHLLFDRQAFGILLAEMSTVYDALAEGRPAPLPDPAIQYGDFAVWQREQRDGGGWEKDLAYWREHLDGAPAALELPTDRPRPAVQGFRGAQLPFELPEELMHRLAALANRRGATTYMALLAVYAVLLHRYSNQDDVVVGSPASVRDRPEIESMLGYFINTLPIRTRLGGSPTFTQVLDEVRTACLGAYAHQEVPFDMIVAELNAPRDLSRPAVYQVSFTYGREPVPTAGFGGARLTRLPVRSEGARFDLELQAFHKDGALRGYFEYDRDLFDESTIARFAGHLRHLAEAVVADPDRCVDGIELLTGDERRRVLVEFNDTARQWPAGDGWIHECVERQVLSSPDAPAVRFDGRELSYLELNRRANQLAHRLIRTGAGRDVLVGVAMERSVELVVALLAVVKTGGAYVPLDPDHPPARLEHMVNDARVPVLLTQRRLREKLPPVHAEVLCVDELAGELDAESGDNPEVAVGGEDAVYVIYTSGSTGLPKGVVNVHAGIRNRLLWMQDAFPLDGTDRVLQKTPFSFDVSVWEFFWPLMTGAALVVARPEGHRDPAYLARLIRDEAVTTVHFVPSMLQVFLTERVEECTTLRRVICSGEALPRDLQDRFLARSGAQLHNLYGPTEAAIDVTHWPCRREDPPGPVPIGRPIANTQVYVLDRFLRPVPVGVAGELHLGGRNLARGYLDRADLTAERFIDDPFDPTPGARLYRTGDLARFRPDGAVEFLGRLDHQVKLRGFRIELGEIEAALAALPGVRETAVLAAELRPGDVRLVAYLTAEPGTVPDVPALAAALRQRLPEYMVPALFEVLDAFPLTPNGKVDRSALPRPAGARPESAAPYVAPADALEDTLAGAWREVLGVQRVGRNDNFFDLGGHSLLLARLRALLAERTGRDVSMVELFQHPTIAALAEHLGRDCRELETTDQDARGRAETRRRSAGRRQQIAQRRTNTHSGR